MTTMKPVAAAIAGALISGAAMYTVGAKTATVDAFTSHGVTVAVLPSPWRLGADHPELISEWLRGWVGAACEQRPDLTGPAQAYVRRRLAEAASGRLRVVVHHSDLIAGCE